MPENAHNEWIAENKSAGSSSDGLRGSGLQLVALVGFLGSAGEKLDNDKLPWGWGRGAFPTPRIALANPLRSHSLGYSLWDLLLEA